MFEKYPIVCMAIGILYLLSVVEEWIKAKEKVKKTAITKEMVETPQELFLPDII